VFARFAPVAPVRTPAQDMTFDLSAAFADTRPAERPAEPASEMAMAPPPGPDPEVLATLARLERFLGAIHSLRP